MADVVGVPGYDRVTGRRAVGRYVVLALVAVVVLVPIYTTVVAAFKPRERVLSNMLVPGPVTLASFRDAWTDGRLARYLFNSFVVAVAVTIGQVLTSLTAAYSFAMMRFPGRRVLFVVFLATLLVPIEATLVVNHQTLQRLGWLNSFQGLAVPFLATAFGIFLIRQVLLTLPADLRDAARIDGVGHLGFIRHVAVPLIRPTLGALSLFAFLTNWNSYLWPSLITTQQDMNTVQSGLRLLQGRLDSPNVVMAGTVIAAVPILVMLVAFQRQLIRGLTAGAVKG